MHSENGPTPRSALATLSLQKLAEFAVREQLIDRADIKGERVTIIQGDNRFILPPRQASTFLIGMLRGRSWFMDDPTPGRSDSFDAGVDGLGPAVEDGQADASQALTATLDSLLSFTKEVGIISGFMKDEQARRVRIDISVCSTDLSYLETLEYLLDCIQDEVRLLKQRN